MEKKTIVARAEVLAGKEKEFMTAATALIEGTRAEAGNISYNLYQNPFCPTLFIFMRSIRTSRLWRCMQHRLTLRLLVRLLKECWHQN